jgi:hypothetical protein
MKLKDVVMISGMPGLYKVLGHRKNGLIVESLVEENKKFSTSPTQKVSILSEIAIFTEEGEARLNQVLHNIKEKEKDNLILPDKKSDNKQLAEFMAAVLPDYDKEKVYMSDVKKLTTWYTILKDKLDFETLLKEEDEEDTSVDGTEKKEITPKADKTPAKPVKIKKLNAPANAGGKNKKLVVNRKQS